MSGDAPGGGRPPGDESDPAESFLDGVRDAHLRPDGGRRAGSDRTPTGGRGEQTRNGGDGDTDGDGARERGRTEFDESCPVTAAIREASILDAVDHVGQPVDGRYGTTRCVRGGTGDATRRVDVRVCRRPDTDPESFADDVATQLHRWATVGGVDGVVRVLDRGGDDRPWVATERTGQTLAGRDTASVSRAFRQATRLSRALAELHDRGIVHAGIDPDNVVFTDCADGPPQPSLTNPGLVDVYRRYEDPAAVLDPRYAAPEYFESDSSLVDRATDVYGLGVVCFRLFTGVAPIAGTAETIAKRVTADEPLPRPSRVDPRLPEAIDDVLLRATATDRFERFDTAHAFHEALEAVATDFAADD